MIEAEKNLKQTGGQKMHESWGEQGRCVLLMKMDCWCSTDCRLGSTNLGTVHCWEHYHI